MTTPSKKQTTPSRRASHFPKLPLSGGPRVLLWSAPPPWRAVPLRPPRSSGTPPASRGLAEHLDSGLGRVRGGKSRAWAEESGLDMPHLYPVSLGLISPLESSPGAPGRRHVSGLEGRGIPFMGRGKVSGTPAHLQDLLRWFRSARVLQSGGPDFSSSIAHLNLCATGRNATWCGENCDPGG